MIPATLKRLWLATLQNTQFVVTTLTIIFALRVRTAHAAWFCIGTLVAAFSAKGLKKLIKQPRPVGAKKYEKTYGMPSTHSCSIAYFGAYLSLATVLLRLHPRITSLVPFYDAHLQTSSFATVSERLLRLVLASGILFSAASVCWSRVRLGHHTKAQVLVGASMGATVALVWLILWEGIDQAIKWTPFAQRIRDSAFSTLKNYSPDFLWSGIRVYGEICERAAEDAFFIGLEAWKDNDWSKLRTLTLLPVRMEEL